MSHELTAVATVSVVLMRDQSVLVLKEVKSDGRVVLALPGGHVEASEGLLAAVHREAQEETGLSIRIRGLVQVLFRTWEEGKLSFRQTFVADITGGELRTEEGAEALWMSQDELTAIPADQWNFGALEAIRLALAGKVISEECILIRDRADIVHISA